MASLSAEQRLAVFKALSADFPLFARRILKILPKAGGNPAPFTLNAAQQALHAAAETQRAETGKVRAIVLKGRQQGISTYTEGRFYWRITHQTGKRAMILTHEQTATDNLFGMVDRFWQHAPEEYRPHLGTSNAKELIFDVLGSRYAVATAGAKDTGRGGTAQLFHGSEIAFWPNAKSHLAGIGQVVPDLPGTEIIYESTANGTANVFHELWQAASAGESEFMPVFIPWFWQPEYRRAVPAGFELDDEARDYMDLFALDMEQMAWRANKISTDFAGDPSQFDQEYPASAALAFSSSSPRALIPSKLVEAARKVRGVEPIGPKIMGVDPAEYGDDYTSVTIRQGRVAKRIAKWRGLGPMETVGKVGLLMDEHKPDAAYIDATNSAGITDRLKEQGYPVTRVHFGESARDDKQYVLVRDEMWGEMKKWLEDKPASIDDDNDLAAQLTGVQKSYDSHRRIKLEPKEAMFKRGLKSPDDGDSLALTFFKGSVNSGSAADYRRLRGYE